MKSAKNNREINKIKITTNNEAKRDHLLEHGFPFEGVRYRCEEYRRNPSSATSAKSLATPPKTAGIPKTPAVSVEIATGPQTAAGKLGSAPTAKKATAPSTQDVSPGRPPMSKRRPKP